MSSVDGVDRGSSTEPARRRAPSGHFAKGAWPSGAPEPGAPEAVLYVAELAAFLRAEADKAGGSLGEGLKTVSARSGVPAGTLRHVADGNRWPGIEILAMVELAYKRDIIGGYSAVLRRRDA